MYNIHLLPASYGDCILIEYGKSGSPKYILIDGGPYENFEEMVAGLKRVVPKLKTIELLVLTHIDIDHLDGMITLLNRDKLPFKIKQVWFNGYDQIESFGDTLGALQGEYISVVIKTKKLVHNKSFKGEAIYIDDYNKLPKIKLSDGMILTILSPGKEALEKLHGKWKEEIKKYPKNADFAKMLGKDKRYDSDEDILGITVEGLQKVKVTGDSSVPNRSTIAFLAEYDNKVCLLAGDATSDYLLKAIEPILTKSGKSRLKLTAWKLAHHGSKKSTLDKLMSKIDCKKMLISSNGKKFKHPDKETIAKLISNNGPNLQFYFNYKTEFNDIWAKPEWQTKYKYKANYPKKANEPGISIKL
jgi:beta-lactamase superfamily II metal-dependent hydrolase